LELAQATVATSSPAVTGAASRRLNRVGGVGVGSRGVGGGSVKRRADGLGLRRMDGTSSSRLFVGRRPICQPSTVCYPKG
jgi:hypothetical protein